MKSWEKEILQYQLDDEEKILKKLRGTYRSAIDEVKDKITILQAKEQTQSVIYQIKYQEQLKKELTSIYSKMYKNMYSDVDSYLKDCYENGFYSTMYKLAKEDIPLIFPMNQEEMTQMIGKTADGIKLSKKIYKNQAQTVKAVQREISKGIAMNSSHADIARNIAKKSETTVNQAYRIARTEGHRVQNEVNYKTLHKAQESGADIVKQWDASIDKRTRPHHAQLDGQIRELDEAFEVNGYGAQYPGGFGIASEDINCRCAVLQRARWALDEEELKTLQDRAKAFGLDKTADFEDFKKKYIEAVKEDVKEIPKIAKPFEGKTYHMNEDGTFSEGMIKNEAQYNIDLDSDQVLNIDVTDMFDDPDIIEMFKNSGGIAKYDTIYESLPNELQAIFDKEYHKVGDPELALKNMLTNKGYKALNITNKNSKYLDLIDNHLEIIDDDVIKKTKKSKLETLTASLKTQEKKLAKVDNKTYSGIWKDDVQLSDYKYKKGSIQAKRNYYEKSLKNSKSNLVRYAGTEYEAKWQSEIDKTLKHLDDLDEFEALGKKYEALETKIASIQKDIKKYSPKVTTPTGEAFTPERKDAAYWFTDANGSTQGADAILRDKCGDVWKNASKFEKDSIYDYTQSYSKFNEPLRGYEYGTNKYLGVGNVDLTKIGTTGYGGYKVGEVKKQIDAMTDIIERSSYDKDIWLQRGCNTTGMDKFFNIDPSDFNLSEKELADKLVGTTPTDGGFFSTGVAKGKGFSSKPIIMNIYAPSGTKMMYAEPFSAFGNGAGRGWDGITKQGYFGSESEMILQRNTKFRVTKVEKRGGTIYIDMEVIEQIL